MKRFFRIGLKTMKWVFIVFCVYLGALFFVEQRIPGEWAEVLLEKALPESLIVHVDSASFGFRHGLHVRGLKIFDSESERPLAVMLSADEIDYYPFMKRLRVEGLDYPRLPDSYYQEGQREGEWRIDGAFPDLGEFQVALLRPKVLGVCPERLDCSLDISSSRLEMKQMHLVWPDQDVRIAVDGFCSVDLGRQEVYGEVDGRARQEHIRPLLTVLDCSFVLPYMDGFTEVREPCRSWCAWKVNLGGKTFDLWLDLHPVLGRYNGVSLAKADGKIHLRNQVRGESLNYEMTAGPIRAVDGDGRFLDGSVVIAGTNDMMVVNIDAKSSQPLANVLKVAGFTGEYVDADVFGDSECRLQFRFPRAMTNNYEVMDGFGHVRVKNGQLMRLKGFKGLIAAMPSVAPAITWLSDTTQASCDYVIEKGVLKTDNVYVEGTLFSIKMYGCFDLVKNQQDFTARVQFAKKDSLVGKVLHPLTWPFTKLLLEFKVTGSPEEPHWKYISVVNRVMEVVQ